MPSLYIVVFTITGGAQSVKTFHANDVTAESLARCFIPENAHMNYVARVIAN